MCLRTINFKLTCRMFSYSELELGAFGAVSGAPFISAGDVPQTPR